MKHRILAIKKQWREELVGSSSRFPRKLLRMHLSSLSWSRKIWILVKTLLFQKELLMNKILSFTLMKIQ